jgi:hypothetical protein
MDATEFLDGYDGIDDKPARALHLGLISRVDLLRWMNGHRDGAMLLSTNCSFPHYRGTHRISVSERPSRAIRWKSIEPRRLEEPRACPGDCLDIGKYPMLEAYL